MTLLISFVLSLLICIIINKRCRFYISSYFFSYLYFYPTISKMLSIKKDHVFNYNKNRKESRIYSDGVFVNILKFITGMNLRVSDETRLNMMKMQRESSKKICMKQYFNELYNKEMNILEFEYTLSKILLIETNRLYNVFDKKQEEELAKYSIVVFEVLNGLSGGMIDGFKLMFRYWKALIIISKILKSAEESKRIMIFGPQLSLITNFSKMIMRCKGTLDMVDGSKLEPYHFLDLQTKFFVFEETNNYKYDILKNIFILTSIFIIFMFPDVNYFTFIFSIILYFIVYYKKDNHNLTFLHRDIDTSNGVENRAFGPKYITCPGAKLTIDYINSLLEFLQQFNILINGDAKWQGIRFKNIINKKNILLKFNKKN